jgi:hypothetical protein
VPRVARHRGILLKKNGYVPLGPLGVWKTVIIRYG